MLTYAPLTLSYSLVPTPSLIRLRGLLHQDKSLAVLLPEAERLQQLNRRFASAVTPAIAQSCRVGALRDDTAIVYCRHGAAAARVRSQAASIARALATAQAPVGQIKVKVRADWARPAPPEKSGLGRAALTAWGDFSDRLQEGELKQAVEKLLRHHNR